LKESGAGAELALHLRGEREVARMQVWTDWNNVMLTKAVDACYCTGVLATLIQKSSDITEHCFLVPSQVTFPQAARVVVRCIEAGPQRMHESFVGLIIEALHDAWPCK
jgi:hypothetical protein